MKRPGARYGTRGRVPTYIGGASPIGTCMYRNGNTYGKGKASLTPTVERHSDSLDRIHCTGHVEGKGSLTLGEKDKEKQMLVGPPWLSWPRPCGKSSLRCV